MECDGAWETKRSRPCGAYSFIWRMASASIHSARLSFTFWSMPVMGRVDMARPLRERPCRPPLVRFSCTRLILLCHKIHLQQGDAW
ncbi:hypothetical protein OKW39_003807 [Paraburkholderia sp. MM6662-R1]